MSLTPSDVFIELFIFWTTIALKGMTTHRNTIYFLLAAQTMMVSYTRPSFFFSWDSFKVEK